MPSYPKDFFADWKEGRDPGLCFVLMPFDVRFSEVWEVIRNTVEGARFNLRCVRADDIARPGYIMEDVLEYIARAGTIIADLSGRNPNVFYELGIAHSTAPPSSVYLLSQTLDDVPFDLRHLRCVVYGPDLTNLQRLLSEALEQGQVRQYRVEVREGQLSKVQARLSGNDRCLYDIEMQGVYLGDDGVKFELRVTRFVVGRDPEVVMKDGQYLGRQYQSISLPWLDWTLRWGGGDRQVATILLQPGKSPLVA